MKDQVMSNETQSTLNKKVELTRKMSKGIRNRLIYMAASTFKN